MTAKEYLQRGWRIERRVRAAEARLEALKQRAERIKSAAPKAVTGGRGRPSTWQDAVDDLCDAQADYAADLSRLCAIQAQVRRAVAGVEDVRLRTLLELRYMSYLSWPAIAEAMGYDVRTIYRMHGRALAAVRLPD